MTRRDSAESSCVLWAKLPDGRAIQVMGHAVVSLTTAQHPFMSRRDINGTVMTWRDMRV
jgi:hypothetical protein